MALSINYNAAAATASRNLQGTSNAIGSTIQKLSSGYRINSAADDPAGLAISENLKAQISGSAAAIKNSSDAVNMIKTAEGALAEVHSLLGTMRTLAVGASNTGVLDQTAIDADQAQITSALDAIDRISANTQFGNKQLLDGTATGMTFQIGANAGQTMTANIDGASSSDLGIASIDVSADASGAITKIDSAISQISTLRASLGSSQNALTSNINSLSITKENLAASQSSITDTDMASSMVELTKNQILMQAGVSMLAQANQAPQALLKLLG